MCLCRSCCFHLHADRANDNREGPGRLLLGKLEVTVKNEGVVLEVDIDLNALGEYDLAPLQADPGPLRDLEAGEVVILGLDEVIEPPAEGQVVEKIARLREGLEDDVLVKTLEAGA